MPDQQRQVDAEDPGRDEDAGGGARNCGAQQRAEMARPYAIRMRRVLNSLAASVAGLAERAAAVGRHRQGDQVHLLIAVTADRGLAGAFNTTIGRATRTLARTLEARGKMVKILAVGRGRSRFSSPGSGQPDHWR